MTERHVTEVASATLHKLGDLDMKVAESSTDIRGRKVLDRTGEEIGKVEELLVDDKERKVRFLLIASGGFLGLGETTFMLPVDAITGLDEDTVHVDQTRERVAGSPKYDPKLVNDQTYWTSAYAHYGYMPFWSLGYIYPTYPYYPARVPRR